jgi:SAM-dependent methyltransferase
MLDKTLEYHKMAEVEVDFWWYKALHYRILKEINANFSDRKDIAILDTGCGTGGLMLLLKTKGYSNICGFDLSEVALDYCKKKELDVQHEDIFLFRDHNMGKTYDVIINSDILCYIDLDRHQKILKDLYTMLNPGGILLINLPAFNVFKGEHDIAVGLLRRYNMSIVNKLFQEYKQIRIYCWPFLLSPLILISRLFQKFMLLFGKPSSAQSDVNLPNSALNSLFFELCKFEINHLAFRNWGSSIFIRIKKA